MSEREVGFAYRLGIMYTVTGHWVTTSYICILAMHVMEYNTSHLCVKL